LQGRFRVRDAALIESGGIPAKTPDHGQLRLTLRDEANAPTSARVYLLNDAGEGFAPDFTYAYTQGARSYAHIAPLRAQLPAGRYTARAMKGLEHAIAEEKFTIVPGEAIELVLEVSRKFDWSAKGWWSGDHHTHLFRHGSSLYPMMDLNDVYAIAQAEGLSFLPFQGVDKYLEAHGEYASPMFIARYTQELTRDFWGHLCPVGYTGVPRLAESGNAAPMNADYIDAVRSAGGAIAYAHPYGPLRKDEELAALANPKAGLIAREWPIDVALGVPCTIDLLAKEDARGDFDLKLRDYMRLLNLGFRCGVSASTDFHLDQGREPIGGLRTYAKAKTLSWKGIAAAYNEGRTFATNGPLLDVQLGNASLGDTLKTRKPRAIDLQIEAASLWGIERATVWVNGRAVKTFEAIDGAIRATETIAIQESGWLIVIVEGPARSEVMVSPEGKPCVPGQYAISSPIYIDVKSSPQRADEDAAAYFVDWCDAVEAGFDSMCAERDAAGEPLTERQKATVRARLSQARAIFAAKSQLE